MIQCPPFFFLPVQCRVLVKVVADHGNVVVIEIVEVDLADGVFVECRFHHGFGGRVSVSVHERERPEKRYAPDVVAGLQGFQNVGGQHQHSFPNHIRG